MSLRTLDRSYERPMNLGAIQNLSHQFEDPDQQNDCYIVGMWTFLVQEIMFFGALFLAYSIYRTLYFSAYLDAHRFLSIDLGFTNTLVLLASSLTMALGVYHAQMGNRKQVMNRLVVVILLSCVFLGIKSVEYKAKFAEKLFPGNGFDFQYGKGIWEEEHKGETAHSGDSALGEAKMAFEGPNQVQFRSAPSVGYNTNVADTTGTGLAVATESPRMQQLNDQNHHAELFFCLYFIMTGLHAIHIIIGMLLMCAFWYMYYIKHPSVDDYMPTEMFGFYWHFVDIVWIFLFPLMYLIS